MHTKQVLVSIKCPVYNHEPYLRQCLDGFVMQKTDFPFEAIVHDDASTDGSAAIIREYAEKYPDIIKPIFEKENQYSKGDGTVAKILNSACKGKYIASCEGDDYWTDPLKLQKQVDFLESHPDYVMCTTRLRVFNGKEQTYSVNLLPNGVTESGREYDLEDCLRGDFYFHIQTLMYRSDATGLAPFRTCKSRFDRVLAYYLLSDGSKGMCLPDITAVYRRNDGGVWAYKSGLERFTIVANAALSVYYNTPDANAARFVYMNLNAGISRKWVLRNKKLFWCMMSIIQKHLGLKSCFRLIWNNLLLGK